jgi:hypothetical protein
MQSAGRDSRLRRQAALRLGNLLQDLLRPFVVKQAGLGQREMTRGPLNKRGAEELFECHELATDGGQGLTQLPTRGRQVASIRNLNEYAHRREFIHGRIIAKNGKMSRQISGY